MIAFKTDNAQETRRFEYIGPGLYRRNSTIYARVWEDGKRTWRSTDTNDPDTARKILKQWRKDVVLKEHGIMPKVAALELKSMTVDAVVDNYLKAGLPDRKMRQKSPTTVHSEQSNLARVRAYFGPRRAVTLTMKDCDAYRDWRGSGGYKWKQGEKDRASKAGTRLVDIELQALGNALALAVRQGKVKSNPLAGRARYHREEDTRHCREVAPTPAELQTIETTLRQGGRGVIADCIMFQAFSGLRINELLPLDWEAVEWGNEVIHVQREKRGINPWVPILPEMKRLLISMQARAKNHLLFPSMRDASRPVPYVTVAKTLAKLCKDLKMKHATTHGLRSYFVTQCRQAGLSDADIAALIGDKSGPAIIARTYGDVRPDHLYAQAKRVKLLFSAAKEPVDVVTQNDKKEVAA